MGRLRFNALAREHGREGGDVTTVLLEADAVESLEATSTSHCGKIRGRRAATRVRTKSGGYFKAIVDFDSFNAARGLALQNDGEIDVEDSRIPDEGEDVPVMGMGQTYRINEGVEAES